MLLIIVKIVKITLDMEKNLAVVEITSNSIRLVVGYILDEQVYILYATTNPIPDDVVINGAVADLESLINELKKIESIKDPVQRLRINISDVILVLPSYGIQIFQTTQVTTVVSEEGKVGLIDLRNLNSLISKERIPSNNELVEVIPDQFVLDQDRVYINPPLGEISNTLTMSAKLHTLPHALLSEYQRAIKLTNMHLSRCIIGTYGAVELIGTYGEYPSDYFLVDIGAKMTTVSFVGRKTLFSSTFFQWGGDNITEAIATKFQINLSDAEKYKMMYGYDYRKMDFEPVVCTIEDENGLKIKHTVTELNQIIKTQLDEFVSKLTYAIQELLKEYDASFKSLPAIFTGGGSLLNGLVQYVEPKITAEKVMLAAPKTIGARHPSYMNCIGAMKASIKSQSLYDETHPKISSVGRVESK